MLDSYGLRNRLIWMINDRLSIEKIFLVLKTAKQGGYPYAQYFFDKRFGCCHQLQSTEWLQPLVDFGCLAAFKMPRTSDLRATTSYQHLNDKQFIDQDFSTDSLYFVVQNQHQNMLSQELTIQSKPDKKYQWLFGAYGFVQQFYNDVNVDIC